MSSTSKGSVNHSIQNDHRCQKRHTIKASNMLERCTSRASQSRHWFWAVSPHRGYRQTNKSAFGKIKVEPPRFLQDKTSTVAITYWGKHQCTWLYNPRETRGCKQAYSRCGLGEQRHTVFCADMSSQKHRAQILYEELVGQS